MISNRAFKRVVSGALFPTLLFLFSAIAHADSQTTDGGLNIEVISAYNLVVDSNVESPSSYGPRAAYLGVKITNVGATTLNDVVAKIGALTDQNTGAGTAGEYPDTQVLPAAGWGYSGAFSLTHEGGAADATRFIASLAPSESSVVYWLISYPVTDTSGNAVTGAANQTADDLVLDYDIWVEAEEGVNSRLTFENRSLNCRSEISAAANKIWPNTTAKVPDKYLTALELSLGWTPGSTPRIPGAIATQGIWYDMGNVGAGFDNNGDGIPDRNAWLQPVGDPNLFDPTVLRLVKSYGLVVVKLNNGTERLIPFEDELYFTNIPENNTGAVGLVFYEFAPLRAGTAQLSPYQEVASGYDNEKFNGDYGVSLGVMQVPAPEVTFSKTGPATVAPNSTLTYTLEATVDPLSAGPYGMPEIGLPVVITEAIPAGTSYVSGSADDNIPAGLPAGKTVSILYSTDGGDTWVLDEPIPASDVTNLQWSLNDVLDPGESMTVTMDVFVPGSFTGSQVYNAACTGLGGTVSDLCDDLLSTVQGVRSIGGLVWSDDGSGGGTVGDGTRQGGELTFLPAIDVTLYPDTDGDGILDASEAATPRDSTLSTAVTGAWTFSNLPDGKFIVQVLIEDPDRPAGYGLSTASLYPVTISGADVGGFEFGFSPILTLDKRILSSTPALEGTQISYDVDITNLLKPDGYSLTRTVESDLWFESSTGSTFTNPNNALAAADSVSATSSTNGALLVGNYVAPHPDAPAGSIVKVEALVRIQLSGSLSSDRLTVNFQRNGSSLGTHDLKEDELHAYIGQLGTVAIDVTSLASWAWSDFQQTNTGLTLTIGGSGGIPTMSVDAFGYRVTTGSTEALEGKVFWTDQFTELKMAEGTVTPLTELIDAIAVLPAIPTEIAFDEINNKVYIGYKSTGLIERREPNGANATSIATGQTNLSGLAVDAVHGYVYWARAGNIGTLTRSELDGSGALVATGFAAPEGIAVDPVSAQVYWVQTQGSSLQIARSDLSFTASTIINLFAPMTIGNGNHNPQDMEIDPVRRKLYWTDDKSGTNDDFIGSVNLDGTSPARFITQANADFGDNPIGLGVDVSSGLLYWSDSTGIHKSTLAAVTSNLLPSTGTLGDVEIPGKFLFSGTYDVDKTLAIVPLEDDYDPAELTFVSASVAPTSVDTVNGLIAWDNVGPIHASATRSIRLTFLVTGSNGNGDNTDVDNTASVTDARLANGLATNDATDTVIITASPAAIIGNRLWSDKNSDGIDGGQGVEPGIARAQVSLYDSTGTTELQRTVTDSQGGYVFRGVVAGTYVVKVDSTTLSAGAVATFDADGTGTAHQSTVTITTGANPADNLNQDFGYRVANTYFGTVWNDFDGSGARNGAEVGIAGVTVQLRNAADSANVATTTTDVNGDYRFIGVSDGSYRLRVVPASLPAGQTWTASGEVFPAGTPADTTRDSLISTGGSIASAGGDVLGGYDFGYRSIGTSAIGDEVFIDKDGDTVKDFDEKGIPGVTVYLYQDLNDDGIYQANYDALITSTSTNANGNYSFTGLSAGNYIVAVDETDPQFPAEIVASTANPHVLALAAATSITTVDFAYRQGANYVETGSIGDFVFYDANRDGEQDLQETGIAGVVLRLYADTDGSLTFNGGDIDYGTAQTSDGSAGNPPLGFYLFSNLTADANPGLTGNNPYIVEVISIPGSASTSLSEQTADPNRDGVPSWDNTYPALPAADNQDTGHWVDLDGSTTLDPGEEGIFVNPGINHFGADFGYQPTGVVGDFVWLDLDQDGLQDIGEVGLRGVAVTATQGGTTLNSTTDADGSYFFQALGTGTWTIALSSPAGMVPTTRVDAAVVGGTGALGANTASALINGAGELTQVTVDGNTLAFAAPNDDDGLKLDFGFRFNGSNTLSGSVVLESMGLQDGNSGEVSDLSLAGVFVSLYDAAGKLLGSVQTDSDGNYLFSNLPDGAYSVSMQNSTSLLAEATCSTDDFAPGSLPPGVGVTDNGASVRLTVSLSADVAQLDFAWVSATEFDYGDLSDSYGTRATNDGARHAVFGSSTLYLGSVAPDVESDGIPGSFADGDDNNGTADEDGVTVLNALLWGEGADTDNDLSIAITGDGWLVAWMDFNDDGDFFDQNEIVLDQAVSTGTLNVQNINLPAGTFTGSGARVSARFRLFPERPQLAEFAFTGAASEGEVEDYVFSLGVLPNADLALDKTFSLLNDADSSGGVTAGDTLRFQIDVTNSGPLDATNVVISDLLPDGYDYVSGSISGGTTRDDTSPADLSWTIASLANGASTTLRLDAVVVSGQTAPGDYLNVAQVEAADQFDPDSVAGDNSTTQDDDDSVRPAIADLSLSKSVALLVDADSNGHMSPGDTVRFSLAVSNAGPDAAANVAVVDTLPAGYTYRAGTIAGGSSTDDAAAPVLDWTIASLANGATATLRLDADIVAGEPNSAYVNYAQITASDTFDADSTPDDESATDDDDDTAAASLPSIALDKTAGQASFSAVGDVLTYTFTVQNTGNVTLTNVSIADPLAAVSGGPIPSLAPGATDTLTFTAAYTVVQGDLDSGSVVNTAEVSGTPPSGPDVIDTDGSTVPAVQNAAITVVKAATSGQFNAVGDVVNYTFTVTNTGNVTLTNVLLTDPKATVAGGPIASLAPGAANSSTFTASYTIAQTDVDAGEFLNTATVTGTPPTGPDATDTDDETVFLSVSGPDIAVVKSTSASQFSAAGDVLDYTFTVTNTGNVTLTNVVLTDPKATVAGGPIATLAPGAVDSSTFTASYTITQADVDANEFVNTAEVTGTPPSGPDVSDTSTSTVPAVQNPSLSIVKTAAASQFNAPGDIVSYTFTVTNAGNVTLTDVMITDPKATVTGGPIATLAPGAVDSGTFTANYTITQTDVDAGEVVNTATVTGTPPTGPDVSTNDEETVFLAVNGSAIAVVKTAAASQYSATGDVVNYTFTVTNTGNVALTNVMLTDPKATVTGGPIASLAPGAVDSGTFTASYTITQTDVDAGQFVNTATVTGTPPSGPAISGTDEETVFLAVSGPAISVIKTASSSQFDEAGDVVNYTFTVTNTGNVSLTNVVLTDPKATVTGGPIASLAPGAVDSGTFTASYIITQTDVDAGEFVNSATVTGTPPSGPLVSGTDEEAVFLAVVGPALGVVKTATSSQFNAVGDVVNYAFTVTNTGNVTLTSVVLTDPKATVVGGPIASLAPGAEDNSTFTASYSITQTDVDAGEFVNTATVTGTPPSGPIISASDDETVSLAANGPAITVLKAATASQFTQAGDVVNYTFTVTNTGNVSLTDVMVSDPLATITGGPIASLAPGVVDSSTFTASYTITRTDLDAGEFVNTAIVTGTPPSGPAVSGTDEETVFLTVSGPAIEVIKTASSNQFNQAGDVVNYTFTVTNTGNVSLTDVMVSDPLASITGGPIASLAPGAVDSGTFTASYIITQTDVDAGEFVNGATVTGTPPSGPEVSGTDEETVLLAINGPAIEVIKTASSSKFNEVGEVVNYTFTVTNTGNVTLTDVVLTDPKATVVGGPIASLAPGAEDISTFTASYTITQADVDAGQFVNAATVIGTPPSGPEVTANDEETVFLAVSGPAIEVIKTASSSQFSEVGDVVNYTFTVTNTGNVTLTDVVLTDPKATVVGGPIASLAPDTEENSTFTATYTVTQADMDAGEFVNTATVTGTPPSGPDVTASDDETVFLSVSGPAIEVIKTASSSQFSEVGDVASYAFTVTNTGNVTLTNVVLTDPKAMIAGGPIPFLAPGAEDNSTFTASYTITQADVDAGEFVNTATVIGTPPSGPDVTANDEETVFLTVSGPAIEVIKTALSSPFNEAGDVVTYAFTVANTGNVTLTNVVLTDPKATVVGGPIDSLAPGAEDNSTFTASYIITQADVDAGEFVNTATVTGTPPSGPDVTAIDEETVFLAVSGPAIEVIKTATSSQFSEAGDVVTYTFSVANTGNVTLTDVMVADPLASVSGGPIPSLAPGAVDNSTFTASYTITQADVEAGEFVNMAIVTGTPPSGSEVSGTDEETVLLAVDGPAIALVKAATSSQFNEAGDTVSYTFTVTNIGSVALTDVAVSDPLANVTGGPIASLAPGAVDSSTFAASYTITQADADAGEFVNTATVTGTPPSGPEVTANDEETVFLALEEPAIALVKTVVEPGYSAVGEELHFTFTVTNTGNVTLRNIVVSDPQAVVAGSPIASLAPGESDSTSYTATYRVTQADIDAGTILNQATVEGTPPSGAGVRVTDSASETVAVIGCPLPVAPQQVVASNGDDAYAVVLTWEPVASATQYRVFRSESCDFDTAELIAETECTCYRDYTTAAASNAAPFGCVPSESSSYCYWVMAVNECGESEPSEPDSGYRGTNQQIISLQEARESVLPSYPNSSTCGSIVAAPDDSLSIRLTADEPIDLDTVWGIIKGEATEFEEVIIVPVSTDGSDIWVTFEPAEPWAPGAIVTMEVGAETIHRTDVGPILHVFEIHADPMSIDESLPDASAVQSKNSDDESTTALYDADPRAIDTAPPFELGSGEVYAIGPNSVYSEPRRVWLPLPEEFRADEVELYYYHAYGNDNGWYLASNIEGWLVPESSLTVEEDGVVYVGFLVRHGGIVQLGRRVAGAPVSNPAAAISPVGYMLGALLVLLLSVLQWKGWVPRSVLREPDPHV